MRKDQEKMLLPCFSIHFKYMEIWSYELQLYLLKSTQKFMAVYLKKAAYTLFNK